MAEAVSLWAGLIGVVLVTYSILRPILGSSLLALPFSDYSWESEDLKQHVEVQPFQYLMIDKCLGCGVLWGLYRGR